MRVIIYEANGKYEMEPREIVPVDNLHHARKVMRELYNVEYECAEWNIRKAWISQSYVEAHIYGYCKDEHVALVLEDDDSLCYRDGELFNNPIE